MDVSDVLLELFGRVPEHVRDAVDGLDAESLVVSPEPGANTIGWQIWHLSRVQDHHLAEILDVEQVWVADDWAQRFGLDPDPSNTGYGHNPDEMESVRPDSADTLIEYYDAVAIRTNEFLAGLAAADLDRIVDERWDPPVTLGVRLVSVADDDIQHAAQAKYLRGILERR